MSSTRKPAEAFPVGDFIREEMDERGWSVADLACRCFTPVAEMVGIIDGSKPLLAKHAEKLSMAFGTGAAVWLNLNHAYKEWRRANTNEKKTLS